MSKRYARFLTAVFCLFLEGLMVWQMLLPDRERSDVENRTLQQRPALTLSSVLDGSYMEDVEAYVQDQFPLRDQWTGLKARTEQLIGKRLFNNIYLCEGETLISKVDAPADGLEKANLNYVSQLAEKSDIPMYLGLIPSAAEVWRDKLPEGAESWDQNAYLAQAAGLGLPMIDFSAALTAHADEPIFYRTDHHWTSLGAFYGANALLEVLGRESLKQESFTPEIASTSWHAVLQVRHPLADAGHHGILGKGGRPHGHLLAHRLSGTQHTVRPELSDREGQIRLLPGRQPTPVRHPE